MTTATGSLVVASGRRLAIQRPRMRTVGSDAHEVALASYQAFADTDLLAEGTVTRLLAGLSTRRYAAGLEPVGEQAEQQATGSQTAELQGHARGSHSSSGSARSGGVGRDAEQHVGADRGVVAVQLDQDVGEQVLEAAVGGVVTGGLGGRAVDALHLAAGGVGADVLGEDRPRFADPLV